MSEIRNPHAFGPLGLDCTTEPLPEGIKVAISGEVDLTNAEALRGHLFGALEQRLPVLVDCTNLAYMDSKGFNVLFDLGEARRVKEVPVVLVLGRRLVRLAEIMNLDHLLPCATSLEEGLRLLKSMQATKPEE